MLFDGISGDYFIFPKSGYLYMYNPTRFNSDNPYRMIYSIKEGPVY